MIPSTKTRGRWLRWAAVPLLAATLAAAQPPAPSAPPGATGPDAGVSQREADGTDWTERLFWNPRERTAASRRAFEEGDYQAAVEPARAARRLAPDDPITGLNLGSALLGAGQPQEALAHLDPAAEALEDRYARRPTEDMARLVAGAHYNQGNARFAAGDMEGAIRAYEQALRRAPHHPDAKFNLELALREQQRRQQQQDEDGQQEDGSQDPQNQDESQGENQQPDQDQQPGEGEQGAGEEGPQQPRQPEPGEGEPDQPQQQPGEPEPSRLPRFEDQPDMTADEAAAILEAVENLEREQRQEEAELRARQRPTKEKDW